ncbi:MotA/TolQ/ExbB proton channel family protein [Verrucomicrobiota bacterium]
MTFIKDLFVKGGPIMWPLLICSLASLTVAVERLIFWWRQEHDKDDNLTERIFSLTEKGDYEAAVAAGKDKTDAFSLTLVSGLTNRHHGLSESMQVEAGNQVERMKQGLSVLDTIITMAPLLGILGTVIGIIESFDLLGAAGIEDPKAVTGGIAQALITTAAGLAIALITLIPFNYLVVRVQKEARKLQEIATQFEIAYRKSGTSNN